MPYRVTVTDQAEKDTHDNYNWWAENRSPNEAAKWFVGINRAIQTLKTFPNRHAFAEERVLRQASIRQMGFGLGSRSTHRILYEVIGEEVVIYRVCSARQDALTLDDLTGE